MSRFVFASPDLARKKAVALRRALLSMGVSRRLTDCQTAVAGIYGYSDLSELVRVGTVGATPTPLDGRLPEAWIAVASRILSIDPAAASAALRAVGPASPLARPRPSASSSPDPRYGFVAFDDRRDPRAGTACVAGGRPFRIASPSALDAETVWWTDVPYDVFLKSSDLSSLPHLRHDRYILLSPAEAIEGAELAADAPPSEVAAAVAFRFSAVMVAAERLATASGADAFSRRDFRRAFSGMFARRAEYPSEDLCAGLSPWDEFTVVSGRPKRHGASRLMCRDRADHARDVLRCSVPVGGFSLRGRADMTSDALEWAASRPGAVLLDVSVVRTDAVFASRRGFGSVSGRALRFWATRESALELARSAEVRVRGAVEWEGAEPAMSMLGTEAASFMASASTWEAGVVAQAVWRSAGMGSRSGNRGPSAGIWTGAEDRMIVAAAADRVFDEGPSVVSYGLGWIRAVCDREDEGRIDGIGRSLGFPVVGSHPMGPAASG